MSDGERLVFERARCRWCRFSMHRYSADGEWLVSRLGGRSEERECVARPNPEDGPLLGHEVAGMAVRNPAWEEAQREAAKAARAAEVVEAAGEEAR